MLWKWKQPMPRLNTMAHPRPANNRIYHPYGKKWHEKRKCASTDDKEKGRRQHFPGLRYQRAETHEWFTLKWMIENKKNQDQPRAFGRSWHKLHVFSFKQMFHHFCSMTSIIILHKDEFCGRRCTKRNCRIYNFAMYLRLVLLWNSYLSPVHTWYIFGRSCLFWFITD